MESIYEFITSTCKKRGMKIEEMQRRLGFSRSTMYRYMKGVNQVTPEVARKFEEVLQLDQMQRIEFAKLISLSAFDQSLIEARYIIDEFIFNGAKKAEQPLEDAEMVFYNNDKFLRNISQMFRFINEYLVKADSGSIKIVNCLDDDIFGHISTFLNKVLDEAKNVTVEHLACFSESDYAQNAMSFINLFSLMHHENYTVLFSEKDLSNSLLNNFMLINLKLSGGADAQEKYFAFSCMEHGMHECIAFDDPFMFSYIDKKYLDIKSNFQNDVLEIDGMSFEDDIFVELEQSYYAHKIKPNPNHTRVPNRVYRSLIDRTDTDTLKMFLSSVYNEEVEESAVRETMEKAIEYMQRREEFSKKCKTIDVYSKNGLLEFVETGRLSDHFYHLPSFNKEEIKMVLTNIYDRYNDQKDDFTVYITEKNFSSNALCLFIYNKQGVGLDFIEPNQEKGLFRSLTIRNERLASIFCDYIENHIPTNHAMTKENTNKLLQQLIQSLDS